MLTDQGGQVVARYDYEPFGEALSHSGQDETYRYTGKGEDPESGLYYFGMRLYDPEVGRFLTLDPARDGINWYIYAENNPLKWIDPTGMSSEDYSLHSPFLPEPIEMDPFTLHLDPTLPLGFPLDSSGSESSTKLTLNLSLSYLLLNSRSSSSSFEILTSPWTLLGVGAGAVTILGWYQGWWKWLFGGPGLAATNKVTSDLSRLDSNTIHHILQSKHGWGRVVSDPMNWAQVSKVIDNTIQHGAEGPYKGVLMKTLEVNRHIVQVTYKIINGIVRISNAWVVK